MGYPGTVTSLFDGPHLPGRIKLQLRTFARDEIAI
jgi:hypothetical protein